MGSPDPDSTVSSPERLPEKMENPNVKSNVNSTSLIGISENGLGTAW